MPEDGGTPKRYVGPGATAIVGTGISVSGFTNPYLGVSLIAAGGVWAAGTAVAPRVRRWRQRGEPPTSGEHLNLLLEPVPAALMPFQFETHPSSPVYLLSLQVRNAGPTGRFDANVVSRSVVGIGETYPDGADFALRWQTPNSEAEQRIPHDRNARLDVAFVVPDAGILRFLGPQNTHWKQLTVAPQTDEVSGHIDLSDIDRGLVPPLRFLFSIRGLSRREFLAIDAEPVAR